MKKTEEGTFSGMEPVPSGSAYDYTKTSRLSIDEKRQLVRETMQWSDDPVKALASLSRKELLEIICAEMGKDRKYSGFTKLQMIEHLVKLISNNTNLSISRQHVSPSIDIDTKIKRQRKHVDFPLSSMQLDQVQSDVREAGIILCQNLSCRASISRQDAFCKRCSCCICHLYDDNKDPSLWLTCESCSWDVKTPCGISCHIECALQHKDFELLDGKFACISCGKLNGLMSTWRKQLIVAMEARRVDVLCQRVSLSCKILEGTEKYQELLKILDSAMKIIENNGGPLDQLSTKMDRTIVNRLEWGAAVQKLCASAMDAFDSSCTNQYYNKAEQETPPACQIHFKGSSPNGVTIVLKCEDCLTRELAVIRIWHRKVSMKDYPDDATCIALGRKKRFNLSGLEHSTEYIFKISMFSKSSTIGSWEAKWTMPALTASSATVSYEEKEENASACLDNFFKRTESMSSNDSKAVLSDHLPKLQILEGIENKCNQPHKMKHIPSPTTPCKSDGVKETACQGNNKLLEGRDYEFSVKTIRKLEHEGFLETDFRVKFLTWFSLKATKDEKRVVSVFINTFIDDLPSLAEQLMDTFRDEICGKQKVGPHSMFCTRFWH
ncbi:hypothetical protein LIER_18643 [Lithospermum erythrorhizon]|uniref:Uncharacterized protein n=1 Tax=Lithospermum erythrorhizon TaxID=34254 RepID=A0AAV3QHE4_LITER